MHCTDKSKTSAWTCAIWAAIIAIYQVPTIQPSQGEKCIMQFHFQCALWNEWIGLNLIFPEVVSTSHQTRSQLATWEWSWKLIYSLCSKRGTSRLGWRCHSGGVGRKPICRCPYSVCSFFSFQGCISRARSQLVTLKGVCCFLLSSPIPAKQTGD